MIGEASQELLRLPVEEFWLYSSLVCLACVACLYYVFRCSFRYRMMQNMPTSLVRSAAQGYNEFKGHAALLPGDPIIAPLTRVNCVWYEYTVEEKQSHYVRGRRRSTWRLHETGVSEGVFFLEGITGNAIIDPDDAEVIHSVSDTWYGSTAHPSAGPRGFSSRPISFGKRYRYHEKRIHAGDPLYVLGEFRTHQPLEPSHQQEALMALLQSWKKAPQQLLNRFDTDRSGEIEPNEWDKAVILAKKQIVQEQLKPRNQSVNHVIKKPAGPRQPFLISAKDEEKLIQHFKYRSWLALTLFFAMGILAAWMFNIRFG